MGLRDHTRGRPHAVSPIQCLAAACEKGYVEAGGHVWREPSEGRVEW